MLLNFCVSIVKDMRDDIKPRDHFSVVRRKILTKHQNKFYKSLAKKEIMIRHEKAKEDAAKEVAAAKGKVAAGKGEADAANEKEDDDNSPILMTREEAFDVEENYGRYVIY